MQPQTRDLLRFLNQNPGLRAQIRAAPDKTLLYAGRFFQPIWKELAQLKHSKPNLADKEILPDVLARIRLPGRPFPTLLDWVKSLDGLQPWDKNGFIAWRAVSGIFASNAVGAVSFQIGSEVRRGDKVFAATEISVLARNPNVDPLTRDMVEYYQRCLQTGKADLNAGYLAG
jgi:hypothetical protein